MKLQCKVLSALVKPFVDEEPPGLPKDLPIEGLANEVISCQVALLLQDAGWEERSLVYVEADCPLPFTLRRVGQLGVQFPCFQDSDDNYLRKTPGLYPDPLLPLDLSVPLRVYTHQWSTLYVDLEPQGLEDAGTHSLHLRFLDQQRQPIGEVNLHFTVLPALLPPQRLKHTRWLHVDALALHYDVPMFSDRHFDILKNYIELGVKRGLNMWLVPIHTPPLDTRVGGERPTAQLVEVRQEDGAWRFGFEQLDRFIAICEKAGVAYYEMAHLFTQWGAHHPPKIVGLKDGQPVQFFGWADEALGDDYRGFLHAYLPALVKHLRQFGIAERCYFHVSDEPESHQLAQYKAVRAMVEPLLEGIPILDAISDPSFVREGAATLPIPATNYLEPFLSMHLPERWTYYCVGQHKDVSNTFLAMPAERTRILGLQLYLYRMDGFLQWAYNFYFSQYADSFLSPWQSTDADGFAPAGDAFQVYPGRDGRPVESLRLMLFLHAMQDLRALQGLEEKIGREAVLELLREEGPLPTLSTWPRGQEYLLKVRGRVNRALLI